MDSQIVDTAYSMGFSHIQYKLSLFQSSHALPTYALEGCEESFTTATACFKQTIRPDHKGLLLLCNLARSCSNKVIK